MKFGVSSWHGARVGVRTYLLDGAIDGGEANGIIRDPNTRSNADLRRLVSFDVFGKARVVGRIIEATSGAKRKLSRYGRNQMGNEPTLALPKGADDFIVYYDARSKDLEKGREGDCWLTNRWLSMKKDIASCGSKYLAYSEGEVEYQGSSGLLLQPELLE
ncbi:hypothetical protein Tco_0206836 [Tanacetum coccineum]